MRRAFVISLLASALGVALAHEPAKGDYMCQAKLVLEPRGSGTIVHLWEQYTDESSATDLKATAAKMETELATSLASLKKAAERK